MSDSHPPSPPSSSPRVADFAATSGVFRIATRASALALWQANHVADRLRGVLPGCHVELVHVSTIGDRDQTGPLAAMGGFGVFTREVQRAVLDGRCHLAVHSLKDLPTVATPGLTLAATPERASTADALVLPASLSRPAELDPATTSKSALDLLPFGAKVGTGSLRRRAQLLHLRPDLQLHEVRGNVDTRLRKLDTGEYDALVLAAAGLERLGLGDRITRRLDPPVMFAAVGQGSLGLECRSDDPATIAAVQKLTDADTWSRVTAERALLAALRAGCHAPVGVETVIAGSELRLRGVVLSADGRERLEVAGIADRSNGVDLAQRIAAELLRSGAARLMGHSE